MDFISAFNNLIGNSPREQRLFRAALGADFDRLERLIKTGVDVNAEYALSNIDYVPSADNVNNIPLVHFAAISCKQDVISFLINKNANFASQYVVGVDEISKLYTGPILHNVVYYIGNLNLGLEKIKFLLDNYKLDVNQTNQHGKTLLDAAIVKHDVGINLLAYLFIDKQAMFNSDLLPNLLNRIREENIELNMLNECLQRGLDITTSKNGNILHYLSTVVDHSVGLQEILDTIQVKYTTNEISKLASATDDDGRTPLSLYAGHPYRRTHTNFFGFLIRHGADVNTQDSQGNTPLMYAGLAQRNDNCELLIAHGADLASENNHGNDALGFALEANPALVYLWSQMYNPELEPELEVEPEPELEPETPSVRYAMK